MNVLIIDPLSMFIQGMATGLKNTMPDIDVKGVNTLDAAWDVLEVDNISVVIIDGEIGNQSSIKMMEKIAAYYPNIRIIVMLMKVKRHAARLYLEHHAVAVISKESSLEILHQVIKTACCGMVCIPSDENLCDENSGDELVMKLSDRQREILSLIAAGESNKQISRLLNISAGTVKSHLESIYRRLNVKNRTQAAMMLSSGE
ncbi:outer membrane component of efflux system [Campylobacter jejuni]|nr:outer membrane component of efflux system [Campylobacter jejuni]